MFVITRKGGEAIKDSFVVGGKMQLYFSQAAAEKDIPMVLNKTKQELFCAKPVEISEGLTWPKK